MDTFGKILGCLIIIGGVIIGANFFIKAYTKVEEPKNNVLYKDSTVLSTSIEDVDFKIDKMEENLGEILFVVNKDDFSYNLRMNDSIPDNLKVGDKVTINCRVFNKKTGNLYISNTDKYDLHLQLERTESADLNLACGVLSIALALCLSTFLF